MSIMMPMPSRLPASSALTTLSLPVQQILSVSLSRTTFYRTNRTNPVPVAHYSSLSGPVLPHEDHCNSNYYNVVVVVHDTQRPRPPAATTTRSTTTPSRSNYYEVQDNSVPQQLLRGPRQLRPAATTPSRRQLLRPAATTPLLLRGPRQLRPAAGPRQLRPDEVLHTSPVPPHEVHSSAGELPGVVHLIFMSRAP